MVARILVVAADPATLDLAAAVLDNDGYVVLRSDGGSATLRTIQSEGYALLGTADMFPHIDGVLLNRYLQDYPRLALPISFWHRPDRSRSGPTRFFSRRRSRSID